MGFVPDPLRDSDPRNLLYSDMAVLSGAELPESGDVERGDWTLNQGRTASCTCHSTVAAFLRATDDKLSPRYIYHKIKTEAAYPSSTLPYGAYMLDSIKAVISSGAPSYEMCPNGDVSSDAVYLDLNPSEQTKADARAYKSDCVYVYVTNGRDSAIKCNQLRQFMSETGYPVKVGITWHASFNNARKTGIVPYEPPTGNTVGHDMLCVAWKNIDGKEYLGFRNSFGANWGDKGRIWIPCDFLKISTGIAILPDPNIPKMEYVEERDVEKEKYIASVLRKKIYEVFPLNVNPNAVKTNTIARSYAGRNWLMIVQAVTYKGWTVTDIINHLYALSREKTWTKAYNLDLTKTK